MLISFLFALGLLVGIPLMAGWEQFGLLGLAVGSILAWLIIGIAKSFEKSAEEDEEILGTYVTEARYYEPWTEKIKHEDKETGEVTYETVEHDEAWEMDVAAGEECIPIDEEDYRRYVEVFGNEEEEEADHEWEAEGEVIDPGYCHVTRWPGSPDVICFEYIRRKYINPILRSNNVYTAEELDEDIVKAYHLTKYGEMELYGTARDTDEAWRLGEKLSDYNCWFREKNIKLNFILLKNAKSVQAMYWQQYWKNGKRNTINVVVGLNDAQKIEWAHVFGWQNEAACIKLRDFVAGLDSLADITAQFNQIEDILKENYSLPDFGQYEFVRSTFPLTGTLITLTVCLGLFCGLFCRPEDKVFKINELIRQGQFAKAEVLLNKILSSSSNVDADIYNSLGCVRLQLYKGQEAYEAFSTAIEKAENDDALSAYLHNRGRLFYQADDLTSAAKDYEQSIKLAKELRQHTACQLYQTYKALKYRKKMNRLARQYQDKYGNIENTCRSAEKAMIIQGNKKYVDLWDGRGIARLFNSFSK